MTRVLILLPTLLLVGCGARSEPTTADAGPAPESAAKQEVSTSAAVVAPKSTKAKAEPTAAAKGTSAPASTAPAAWSATFKDAQLDTLVAEALANSSDLTQVAERLTQAQARGQQAASELGASIAFAAGAVDGGAGEIPRTGGAGSAFTWEADIWKRLGVPDTAAQANALDQHWARESLAANVAKALFLARIAASQETLGRAVLAEQDRLVKALDARKQQGQATDDAVAAARAGLDEVLQRLTQASVSREQAVRSLEQVLGRQPTGELVITDFPDAPAVVPVGLSSQLLERRPDVIAATRVVARAFNQSDSTKAARLPRLALTAGGGLATSEFQRLAADGQFWNGISNLVGVLYDGGRLQDLVVIEAADQKAALAAYGQVGLQAFRQVESALGSTARLDQRAAVAAETLTTRERALVASATSDDAMARLQVLQAQALVQTLRAAQLTARVDLFLALGGGFDTPTPNKDDLAQPPRVEVR